MKSRSRPRAGRGRGDPVRRLYAAARPRRRIRAGQRRPRRPTPRPAGAPARRRRARPPRPATVRLQLQWAPQAQFAGYFAADEQGYYEAENLDGRRSSPGGPDVVPQQVGSAAGRPGVHDPLGAEGPRGPRGSGSDLVDIAQIFQRSGTLSVSWKDSEHHRPVRASPARRSASGTSATSSRSPPAALTCGLTPGLENNGDPATQYQKVIQPFDMIAAPRHADRRRRGDDLQRVRPGPRGDEPRDRRAVQARRPQRHQLERLPHRDAPGRDLRPRGVARRRRATATSPSASSGPRSRAGSTAATTRPTASSTRPTPAASSAPGTRRG